MQSQGLPSLQPLSHQPPTGAVMEKPNPLPWAEETDSQEQLCFKAAPGISLRQGLCASHPTAWIFPFPFHLQLTSFSQEPTLMKHSCRNPHLGSASGELNPRLLSLGMDSKETGSLIIVPWIKVSRTQHSLKQLHSSLFSKKTLCY